MILATNTAIAAATNTAASVAFATAVSVATLVVMKLLLGGGVKAWVVSEGSCEWRLSKAIDYVDVIPIGRPGYEIKGAIIGRR